MPLSRIFSFRSKNKETNTSKNLKIKITHPKPINESGYANSLAGEVVTIKLNDQSNNFIKSEKVVLTSFKSASPESDIQNSLNELDVLLDNIKMDIKALGEISYKVSS
ncbi:hypothetical protein N7281_05700 [Rickettsia hoogstraalii]|uniref:hypothetical protein n=1 Tax=Rickettsia hoogstraalii TaxID=467174 RepID=UPI00224F737D|nr:hypothetical protein [Rickettsia hoogstraalii]MCX4084324.1 hypothetical protein [Rickettsia hoogstraalii]